jgi:uncharacterized membrane protein HdeD (DUF308 family)
MSYGPPWKVALTGGVFVVAGVALLMVDWGLAQLVAFVAMLLIARGALHAVTASFAGVTGALSGLQAAAEASVGILLLVWPHPTLLVVGVVVGVLVLLQGTVDGAIVLSTSAERPHWPLRLVADLVQNALGIALIARVGGTLHATGLTLGALAVLAGVLEIASAFAGIRKERGARLGVRSVVVSS